MGLRRLKGQSPIAPALLQLEPGHLIWKNLRRFRPTGHVLSHVDFGALSQTVERYTSRRRERWPGDIASQTFYGSRADRLLSSSKPSANHASRPRCSTPSSLRSAKILACRRLPHIDALVNVGKNGQPDENHRDAGDVRSQGSAAPSREVHHSGRGRRGASYGDSTATPSDRERHARQSPLVPLSVSRLAA